MGSPTLRSKTAFHRPHALWIRRARPPRLPQSTQSDSSPSFRHLPANEILRVIGAAAALILGDLRIRAERARSFHRSVIDARGDHHIRCVAFFHPLLDRADLVEHIRAFTAAAMAHSRFQEETD